MMFHTHILTSIKLMMLFFKTFSIIWKGTHSPTISILLYQNGYFQKKVSRNGWRGVDFGWCARFDGFFGQSRSLPMIANKTLRLNEWRSSFSVFSHLVVSVFWRWGWLDCHSWYSDGQWCDGGRCRGGLWCGSWRCKGSSWGWINLCVYCGYRLVFLGQA